MRVLTTFCASIVAFSLLAAPAKADAIGNGNNTSETVFLFIDLGGFSGGGDGEDGEYEYAFASYYEQYPNILVINLASVNGTIENFLGLTFAELNINWEGDLSGLSYFILGHITGSDHLILSDGEGDPGALPDGYETGIIEGIRNMDDTDPTLADPGGSALITPDEFNTRLGVPVTDFSDPMSGPIPFDPVASVGSETDLLGFTDPVFLTRVFIGFENGMLVVRQVPEPGLAILAVLGVAGAVIARRRRRVAA